MATPRGAPGRAPRDPLRRAGRRGHDEPGGPLERDRPSRSPARGVRRDRTLPEGAAHRRPHGTARNRLHREGAPHRPAGRPGALLSRDLRRSRRPEPDQRARRRPGQDGAGGRRRRELRVVGRHRWARLGHQPRVGWHAPLRRDASRRAGLLRQQRRSRLCRRPPQGRGRPSRRRRVEERRHPREIEGRRDHRGVPRPATATTSPTSTSGASTPRFPCTSSGTTTTCLDNWFPGQIVDDDRYTVKSTDVLAAHARQAMREFTPLMPSRERPGAHLPPHRPGPASRSLHARHAELPGTERRES